MLKLFFLIILLSSSSNLFAQNELEFIVKDFHTNIALPGTLIKIDGTNNRTITNDNGYAKLTNIPNGMQKIKISFVGFEDKIYNLFFPLKLKKPISVWLKINEMILYDYYIAK